MKLTPNDVEVLIHHAVSPGTHPRHDAPAVQDSIARFIKDGVFDVSPEGRTYATHKGYAWLEAICSVQPPSSSQESDFPKVITVEEGDVFELVNRVANPCVEQALEIIHLLPVEDPIRLDLLRVCGKQLVGQLTYVAVITSKEAK